MIIEYFKTQMNIDKAIWSHLGGGGRCVLNVMMEVSYGHNVL